MILSVQIEFLGKLQVFIMLIFPPFLQEKKMLNPKGRPTLSVSMPPRWVLPAVDITLQKLHLPHPVLPSLLHYEPTIYANENFELADTSSPCSQLCYYTRLPHTLQHDIRFNVSLPLNA
jgi:hypothetical protein